MFFRYYYHASVLLTGSLAIALGLFVFSRNLKDARYLTYGIFCLCLGVWGFAYFLLLIASNSADALLWARVLNAAALFIPVTSYHHIIQLIGVSSGTRGRILRAGYLLSFLLLLLSPTHFLISSVTPKLKFAYWPNPGPLYLLHSLMFTFFAFCVVVELYIATKSSLGRRRTHLQMLLLTIVLAYIGGGTNHPLLYDIPIPPVGNILIAIYIVVFAYGILIYRLLDIEIILKKSLIYALLLACLLVPCFFVVVWGQMLAFGTINYTFSMTTLLLFISIGFLFPKMRFRTEEALERVLFQKRVNYRETLLRSSREMVSIVDLEHLSDGLVRTVSRALGTETASFYLLDETKGVYNLKANIGQDKNGYPLAMLSKSDPLVQCLTGNQEGIVKEELE
ncbi:MAG TPA: histidine kinase N-terminal 7TM domain-containing protein, partial [Candidatus Binatia bacterium]